MRVLIDGGPICKGKSFEIIAVTMPIEWEIYCVFCHNHAVAKVNARFSTPNIG